MDDDFSPPITPRMRIMLMAFRQALLIMVGALEVYLGLPRSRPPNHHITNC